MGSGSRRVSSSVQFQRRAGDCVSSNEQFCIQAEENLGETLETGRGIFAGCFFTTLHLFVFFDLKVNCVR